MKPMIAITAGDVAGVGPEVILRAIQDTEVLSVCHPILIWHVEVFWMTAKVFGQRISLRECADASDTTYLRTAVVDAETKREILCVNPAGDTVLSAPRCRVSR